MAAYFKYLTNELTGETVLIKSNDQFTFQSKVNKKLEQWEKQNHKILRAQEAAIKSEMAKNLINEYKNILNHTLEVDDKLDWDSLLKKEEFRSHPEKESYVKEVSSYKVFKITPFTKNIYENKLNEAESKFNEDFSKWQREKANFEKGQEKYNELISKFKEKFEGGDQNAVKKYFTAVLRKSKYPEGYAKKFEITYAPQSRLVIVDYVLPNTQNVPRVVESRYVAARDDFDEKELKGKEFSVYYNSILRQIALRSIHELFESDYKDYLDIVVFNGVVNSINKRTGHASDQYVLSLQVTKDDFFSINLANVDPVESFRHFKGVSAGDLVELNPVKPIMKLDKQDKRIITAESVVDNYDETTNLATVEWQDFEVLVRDLIQKEFAREGCTVEVTQASRDAGVDALAFDEDPIRGGKYVIQAKRYNNLVPLTAVRDLYGTVHNEGAVKGILITTSYFGKDAIEFVKDKPLTLINGEGLLHMFNKHGYNFKIELQKKQQQVSKTVY